MPPPQDDTSQTSVEEADAKNPKLTRKQKKRVARRQVNVLTATEKAIFQPSRGTVGVLVTKELEEATRRCRERVQDIAAECRASNRKFRDLEWDLEKDQDLCLHGCHPELPYSPAGVLRVSAIFKEPHFFIDGVSSSDIEQGILGDCWFVSALATVACVPNLIERICVERDEVVGVYGFIFFRDGRWVDVVVDDQLYVANPRYEELTTPEQRLYHDDPDFYTATARMGRKTIYFARSQTEGETWVSLLEKAYAKIHGDYSSLNFGYATDAMEDLTGGVCQIIPVADILDTEVLWKDLVDQSRHTRIFGCFLPSFSSARNDNSTIRVQGLVPLHAYSVLKAINYKGKQFVLVRNPWAKGEWTGRWSDGSKEWTPEWQGALKELNHTPGDDGVFVMEYRDFLQQWGTLECTRLFDSNWAQSTHWLSINNLSETRSWSYGNVSWTLSVEKHTPAFIILQQLDTRYFRDCASHLNYQFDFKVYRKGDEKPRASSSIPYFQQRSYHVELELSPGEYVIHVRIDCHVRVQPDWYSTNSPTWNARKLARVKAARSLAQSIAVNFALEEHQNTLQIPVEAFRGNDLTELEIRTVENKRAEQKKLEEQIKPPEAIAAPTPASPKEIKGSPNVEKQAEATAEDKPTGTEAEVKPVPALGSKEDAKDDQNTQPTVKTEPEKTVPEHDSCQCNGCKLTPIKGTRWKCMHPKCYRYNLCQSCFEKKIHEPSHKFLKLEKAEESTEYLTQTVDDQDHVPLVLGLRVLTHVGAPAKLDGQLRFVKSIKWDGPQANEQS